MEEGRDMRFHDMLGMGLLAALEEAGLARLLSLGGDQSPCGSRNLRIEFLDLGGLGSVSRIILTPVGEEAGGLIRSALFRGCEKRLEHKRRELVERVGHRGGN